MRTIIILAILTCTFTRSWAQSSDEHWIKVCMDGVLEATEFPEDSLDFVMNEDVVNAFLQENGEQGDFYPLSMMEMKRCRQMLDELLKSPKQYPLCGMRGLPLREYFRQYYAFQENEQIFVLIKLNHSIGLIPKVSSWQEIKTWAFEELNKPFPLVFDGGNTYGTCFINLTQNEISLVFNGVA